MRSTSSGTRTARSARPRKLSAAERSALNQALAKALAFKDSGKMQEVWTRQLPCTRPTGCGYRPASVQSTTASRGICSAEADPYADAQALHGLALLCRGLPRVKADPSDLAARLECQIGSWLSMGPLASGVPMGASHGIGYVLGAVFGIPHGHTSCIMLPVVMRWNKPANAERQALVAAAMGHPGEDAGEVLAALIADLGMPRSLATVKIGPENSTRLAEQAMDTPWVPRNPRPIASPVQVREILELAA